MFRKVEETEDRRAGRGRIQRILPEYDPDYPSDVFHIHIPKALTIITFRFVLDLFKHGRQFHAAVERDLTQEKPPDDEEVPGEVAGYLESISYVLEDVTGVRAIESAVEHQSLRYLGIVDCVAMYK